MVKSEEEVSITIAFYKGIVLREESLEDGITHLHIKDGYKLDKVVDIVKDYYNHCTEIEAPWQYILQNESGEQSPVFYINEEELGFWDYTNKPDTDGR